MSGDNSCLPGRKEDILKKKMERKGWLRSLIAGCMILFILFTCLPADWNLSAGTVYAAGTDGTLAAPDGDADPSGGSMQKGESNRVGADKAAGGEGTAAQTPADERDTAAQNTAAGERDTAAQKEAEDEKDTGSQDAVPGNADTAAHSEAADTAAGGDSTQEGMSEPASENAGKDRSETSAAPAAEESSAGAQTGGQNSAAETKDDSAAPAGTGAQESQTGDDSDGKAGAVPDAGSTENGNGSAVPSDAAPSDAAAAASTEPPAEEPWMTLKEFNRALNSVTAGAKAAAGYIPSKATIVSKDSEINYEKLGIGNNDDGHINLTTPINVEDSKGIEYKGVCVVPDDRGLPRWSVLSGIQAVTDAVIIKLYYYAMLDGYGEKLAKDRGYGSHAEEVAIAACHEAMSMRYAELAGISYNRPNLKSSFRSLISDYRSGALSKALPDLNKVHIYISARTQKDGQWMQAYVFGFIDEDQPTSIVLKKVSSDPDMRNAYSAYYCLHETANGGKVMFGVYTDKACTQKARVYTDANMTNAISEVPVGMNGKSGLWNEAIFYCDSGTYYLKELNTPRGYQTHSAPFGPYTVKQGSGLTIKVTNTPHYAKAGIIKKDATTGRVLAGARYGFYPDLEDARNGDAPAAVFTTGNDGKSNLVEVIAGKSYYVREISAPEGFKKDTEIHELKIAKSVSETVWTELSDQPDTGKVQVKKASSDPAADTNDAASPYSLAGAVYTLYDSDGAAAGTLQTNKDGSSNVLTVKCGSYTLKETKPSPGFALDVTSHKVTVTGGSNTTVSSIEPVLKAKLTVKKVSSEEKEGKAPDTLPIKGAVYSLYQTEEDAREEKACAGTFLVQEDGTANVLEVIAGKTYYIKETKTPEGYLTDEKIHAVRAALPLETYTVESEDKLIFGGVRVGKRDLETGGQNPLGGASLEGAVMKIYNDGTLSVYADGKKILPGGEAMTLVTEADGTAATPDHALSYGSYRVEETLPPEGYTMEGAKPVRFKITEDGKIIDLSSSEETFVKDRVMRGDFSIRKIQGYTQKRMAGVTFEITSYDKYGKELEKHRFTTDENGFFDSKASWAAQQRGQKKPQEADAADAGDDTGTQNAQQNGQTQENGDAAQAEEESGRLWFGVGTKPDERLGALPYGSYHIEEIEGENNRGMKMYSDDFSIYGDGQALALGNIENTLKPVLETELVDENGDHFADQKGIITLTDTVTYGGMEDYIGKEVTFHGVIYVKETQKPLQIGGRTIESVVTRKILSPAGTVRLQFTFDAAGAQGMTLVCFEYASEPGPVEDDPAGERPDSPHTGDYHDSTNGGEDIVSHTDIDDASQTVQQISIETDARDQLTGMHVGEARDGAVTVDHVTCRGVTPGQDYLVTGFLVDKATGSPLKDHSGKRITAKASFTAKKTVETVDLTFTYDASLLEGTTVVAFERLYLKGGKKPAEPKDDTPDHPSDDTPDTPDDEPDDTPVARHEDPEDEDQSVHYPKIRTKAAAANSSDENSAAGNIGSTENSTDAGKAGGSSALVRETELTKSVTADGKLIVRDHVSWKNLLPGRNYRLQGSLMRKDDGKPFTVDGSPLTARVQFTPGTPDGETILDFAFDGTALFAKSRTAAESGDQSGTQKLQSMEIVAFEELYILTEDSDGQKTGDSGDGNKQDTGREYLVASHKDLQDPAQTVLLREPETPQTPGKYTDIPEEPGKSNGLEKEEKGSAKGSGRKSVTPASPQTVRNGSPVKTGDETNLAAYLLPFAMAALGITALVIAGRHRNNKR